MKEWMRDLGFWEMFSSFAIFEYDCVRKRGLGWSKSPPLRLRTD